MNYCDLLLLTVCAADMVVDRGQNITLQCFYNVPHEKPLKSCWSRGTLPLRGMCGLRPVIFANGSAVTERLSKRYLLLGRLDEGNVSLTILNTSEEDNGIYGCRVDVPGLGNDHKVHISLKIRNAAGLTSTMAPLSTSPVYITTTRHMTHSDHVTRLDHVTSGVRLRASSSGTDAEDRSSEAPQIGLLLSLVCIITIIITTVILLLVRKRHLLKKMSGNLISVQFTSTSSNIHLQQRAPPEENIYN